MPHSPGSLSLSERGGRGKWPGRIDHKHNQLAEIRRAAVGDLDRSIAPRARLGPTSRNSGHPMGSPYAKLSCKHVERFGPWMSVHDGYAAAGATPFVDPKEILWRNDRREGSNLGHLGAAR